MIHSVISYLNQLISGLDMFTAVHGLVALEPMQDSDGIKIVPAEYKGGGESDAIDFDFLQSLCYHRLNGEQTSTENDSEVGCGTNVTITTPVKLVCYVNRNIYNTDNADIDVKISHNVRSAISISNIKALAKELQVTSIGVVVDSVDTRKIDVFTSEFDGVEYTVPSNYALFAISYNIVITGEESCMLGYGCNDEEIDIEELIIDNICPVVTIYNADGSINTTVAAGGSFTLPEIGGNVMIKSYLSTASTTQTFAEFIGYDIDDMYINVQGIGNMGHLAGLSTARRLITNWNSATGVATFKDALTAGWQITVIGTN